MSIRTIREADIASLSGYKLVLNTGAYDWPNCRPCVLFEIACLEPTTYMSEPGYNSCNPEYYLSEAEARVAFDSRLKSADPFQPVKRLPILGTWPRELGIQRSA